MCKTLLNISYEIVTWSTMNVQIHFSHMKSYWSKNIKKAIVLLQRGKFRPRLTQLVQTNTSEAVKEVTCNAFKCLPDVKLAITELTTLKAVGPATASGQWKQGFSGTLATCVYWWQYVEYIIKCLFEGQELLRWRKHSSKQVWSINKLHSWKVNSESSSRMSLFWLYSRFICCF